MKLATKISGGFGLLIVIALALGGLAVFNMYGVKTVAQAMDNQAVPAVQVANNVERHSLFTIYAARGYAMTEDWHVTCGTYSNCVTARA